jgi:DNA-directed RNA polymerase subunit F
MKETLEEVAHKALIDYGIKYKGEKVNISEVEKLMVSMAKWQQERSYSEEEILDLLQSFANEDFSNVINIKKWFEQFKKK